MSKQSKSKKQPVNVIDAEATVSVLIFFYEGDQIGGMVRTEMHGDRLEHNQSVELAGELIAEYLASAERAARLRQVTAEPEGAQS